MDGIIIDEVKVTHTLISEENDDVIFDKESKAYPSLPILIVQQKGMFWASSINFVLNTLQYINIGGKQQTWLVIRMLSKINK